MNRLLLILSIGVFMAPLTHAVEVLRWERLPLSVLLRVGQERVILADRNLRIGVPPAIADRLRIQSTGGALYLHANTSFEATRLQLQDAQSGAIILIDVKAEPALPDDPVLEPIRIVDGDPVQVGKDDSEPPSPQTNQRAADTYQRTAATPIPVVLTRFAAQSLYAPLRTVESAIGVNQVSVQRGLSLDTLLPLLPVRATALAAWRLDDYWLTAIRLAHTTGGWLTLDPRALQGNFVAATFQHGDLGPAGDSTDTTVLYLITRGNGLREALLPTISPIDTATNVSRSISEEGDSREK